MLPPQTAQEQRTADDRVQALAQAPALLQPRLGFLTHRTAEEKPCPTRLP